MENKNNLNYKQVTKILTNILFINLFVAVLKMAIGFTIRSASLAADGFHSLSDGLSNVIGIIGIKFASKPDDDCHPYGHNKIESLAGMAIGLILAFVGCTAVYTAIYKFKNPVEPNITIMSLVALVITLIINLFVTTYESRKGKELNSTILISDANHTKSDIFISIGVLITLVGVKLGLPILLDPVVTIIVALFIFHASWEVLEENWNILIDTSKISNEDVEKCVMNNEDVKNVHGIRSRGTHNRVYIDMHILVDPNMTVHESHQLQHKIEKTIQSEINENTNVIIHVEPFFDNDK